ncbi:MAG: DUF3168 domain-containing protein [Litorimonas sp.]
MSALDLAQAALTMQADIHSALSESLAMTLALGDPVRAYDDPPESPVYPYLTYGNVRSTDTSGDGAPQSTHQISLHLWSRYSGRSELLDLMRLIESTLDAGLPHTVTPLYLDVFRAPDGITFHGLLRLSVTLSTPLSLETSL